MKAEYKIKREILREVQKHNPNDFNFGPLDTAEQIDAAYGILRDEYAHCDPESVYRCGHLITNISPPSSRHYESDSVAAQTTEGDWVGWTYWYGGGKHGEPGEIDWMEDAYNLTCKEEEKVVIDRTFTKID